MDRKVAPRETRSMPFAESKRTGKELTSSSFLPDYFRFIDLRALVHGGPSRSSGLVLRKPLVLYRLTGVSLQYPRCPKLFRHNTPALCSNAKRVGRIHLAADTPSGPGCKSMHLSYRESSPVDDHRSHSEPRSIQKRLALFANWIARSIESRPGR
jgi:hypothetical protein